MMVLGMLCLMLKISWWQVLWNKYVVQNATKWYRDFIIAKPKPRPWHASYIMIIVLYMFILYTTSIYYISMQLIYSGTGQQSQNLSSTLLG